jgi:hypothetical protein
MGMRAVAQFATPGSTVAFYAQWGSPAFKLPAIADWLGQCVDNGRVPSAADYLDQTAAEERFDHFTETFEAHSLPSDLDWVYDLSITALEPAQRLLGSPEWFGRLDVRGPRSWRTDGDVITLTARHVIRFDAGDLNDFGRVIVPLVAQRLSHYAANPGSAREGEREWWQDVLDWWQPAV